MLGRRVHQFLLACIWMLIHDDHTRCMTMWALAKKQELVLSHELRDFGR